MGEYRLETTLERRMKKPENRIIEFAIETKPKIKHASSQRMLMLFLSNTLINIGIASSNLAIPLFFLAAAADGLVGLAMTKA
ncbi:unnamed protein product [Camellia sinensis]